MFWQRFLILVVEKFLVYKKAAAKAAAFIIEYVPCR